MARKRVVDQQARPARCENNHQHTGHPVRCRVASLIATTRRLSLPKLNVGSSDHSAPFLGVCLNELGEFGGRTWKRFAPYRGNPRLHPGIGEGGIDLAVEPIDNFDRRFLGRGDAEQGASREARQKITERAG
jgi:hypothetical protein